MYFCSCKLFDIIMTKQSIARIFLLVQILLFQTVGWAADSSDVCCCKKDSAKLILTGDAAYKWIGEHLDSLAESYLAKNGNILDPDIVRDELKTIGYNGLNVTDYIMGPPRAASPPARNSRIS